MWDYFKKSWVPVIILLFVAACVGYTVYTYVPVN